MSVEFRAEEFMAGHKKIAAFVTGYDGKVAHYQQAIHDLQANGYDIVAYEYANTVLTEGIPDNFGGLIELIERDFDTRAASYKLRRYAGVSFGARICINLQKRATAPTDPGMYGSAGIDIPKIPSFPNPVI